MRMVRVVRVRAHQGDRGRNVCRDCDVMIGMLMEPAVCQPGPGQCEAKNECKTDGRPAGPVEKIE
jgi:hypothetical protein